MGDKLKIENIYKSFEDTKVLSDISLTLKSEEFLSIIGPSGCGKSTIFNIISGILKPDSGKVYIEDEDFTGKTARVSYMQQKDLLLPWKDIIDNVCIPLLLKGEKKKAAREKAATYFDTFGLAGFEHKYPFQLSGGMKQRAALLRTYLFSSDVLLLDEPFGGLDELTKRKMYVWLKAVTSELHLSVLFITHDIEEAIFLSDRILIFSDRPARLVNEVPVSLGKVRNKEIVTSRDFIKIKEDILRALNL